MVCLEGEGGKGEREGGLIILHYEIVIVRFGEPEINGTTFMLSQNVMVFTMYS